MRFRKIIAMLLVAIFLVSSLSVLTSAEGVANNTMLHIIDGGNRNAYLAKSVNLTVGKTYIFTFRQKFLKGDIGFGGDGRGVGVALFFKNNAGGVNISNRSTWREDWDDRRPSYQMLNSDSGLVSFKFTVSKHSWDESNQIMSAIIPPL